jgi:hypothetical protein
VRFVAVAALRVRVAGGRVAVEARLGRLGAAA